MIRARKETRDEGEDVDCITLKGVMALPVVLIYASVLPYVTPIQGVTIRQNL